MVNLHKKQLLIYESAYLGAVFVCDNEIRIVKFFDIIISGAYVEL